MIRGRRRPRSGRAGSRPRPLDVEAPPSRRAGIGFIALLGALFSARLAAAENPVGDLTPPRITHDPLGKATAGGPLVIEAEIEDESPIFAPAVYFRSAPRERYVSVPMHEVRAGRFEALLPAPSVTGVVEYFIEAFDEHGNGPSRVGGPEAPLRARVVEPVSPALPRASLPADDGSVPGPEEAGFLGEGREPEKGEGLATKWWFWAVLGVAVVGAASVGVVLLSQPSPQDIVTVRVTGPSPTRGP